VADPKYAGIHGIDPFFDIGFQQGLAGLVDGDHYFDAIADDARVRLSIFDFPGGPQTSRRDALMALYASYGDNIVLHGATSCRAPIAGPSVGHHRIRCPW